MTVLQNHMTATHFRKLCNLPHARQWRVGSGVCTPYVSLLAYGVFRQFWKCKNHVLKQTSLPSSSIHILTLEVIKILIR